MSRTRKQRGMKPNHPKPQRLVGFTHQGFTIDDIARGTIERLPSARPHEVIEVSQIGELVHEAWAAARAVEARLDAVMTRDARRTMLWRADQIAAYTTDHWVWDDVLPGTAPPAAPPIDPEY